MNPAKNTPTITNYFNKKNFYKMNRSPIDIEDDSLSDDTLKWIDSIHKEEEEEEMKKRVEEEVRASLQKNYK